MKKQNLLLIKEGVIALLFLLLFALGACTSRVYTPEIKSEFEVNALCTFGDFKYNCKIVKTAGAVSVTPLDTRAQGMTMRCDGKTVAFIKGSMKREFPVESLDVTNPSIVLYQAFNSVDTANAEPSENGVVFKNSVSAGEYSLLITRDNELKELSVNSAKLHFDFSADN